LLKFGKYLCHALANKLLLIPENVTVKSEASVITITGPMGTMTHSIPPKIQVSVENNQLKVSRLAEDKQTRFEPRFSPGSFK